MQKNGKLPYAPANVLEMPASAPETPASTLGTPAITPETPASTPAVRAITPETPAVTPETPATIPEARAVHLKTPANNLKIAAAGTPAPASKRQRGLYQVKGSIERRLMVAKVAIEAALGDPMLQEALAQYGYAPAELRQGQALRTQALALVQQRHARVGKQVAATDARAKAQAQLRATYTRHVAFARIAFRGDRDAARTLDLSARKGTLAGWVLQAQQFYANALADQAIVARLARYSITKEQLAAAQAQVEAVAGAIMTQQSRTGLAKDAKRARDTALHALDRWMLEFIAVARVALADQPQRLAQMGLAGR